jgi:hypothetical protein
MLALMQDEGTRGNGRPEYRYSWFGWANGIRFDRDRNGPGGNNL